MHVFAVKDSAFVEVHTCRSVLKVTGVQVTGANTRMLKAGCM